MGGYPQSSCGFFEWEILHGTIALGKPWHEWLLEELGSDMTGFLLRHQVKAVGTTLIAWIDGRDVDKINGRSPWNKGNMGVNP